MGKLQQRRGFQHPWVLTRLSPPPTGACEMRQLLETPGCRGAAAEQGLSSLPPAMALRRGAEVKLRELRWFGSRSSADGCGGSCPLLAQQKESRASVAPTVTMTLQPRAGHGAGQQCCRDLFLSTRCEPSSWHRTRECFYNLSSQTGTRAEGTRARPCRKELLLFPCTQTHLSRGRLGAGGQSLTAPSR